MGKLINKLSPSEIVRIENIKDELYSLKLDELNALIQDLPDIYNEVCESHLGVDSDVDTWTELINILKSEKNT